jgi:hypothetical protein
MPLNRLINPLETKGELQSHCGWRSVRSALLVSLLSCGLWPVFFLTPHHNNVEAPPMMAFWLCSLPYICLCQLYVLTCLQFHCMCAFLQRLNSFNHKDYSACTWPMSFQALYSWSCPVLLSYGSKGILVSWKVVRFWAAKFKPLLFSVSDFVFSRVPKTFIPEIFYNITYVFCLHNYVINPYI